jgi:acetoin utilization protein AcuB
MGGRGSSKGDDFGRREVADVALRNFIHARGETSLLEVAQLMSSARIRHLLIVEDRRLAGVLSYRDVLEFAVSGGAGATALEGLRATRAAELMRRDPIVVEPTTNLREAARRMVAHRVGCLPVVDGPSPDARVVGILTESDLLRAAFGLGV